MSINSISIKNIRGFTTSSTIPIKPITLLVGANSSGKSTLARLFPLLRQSIETKTKGPILWYGPYVDFGSYEDAKPKKTITDETVIAFEYTLCSLTQPVGHLRSLTIYDDLSIHVELSLRVNSATKTSFISSLALSVYNHKVTLEFDPEGVCTSYSLNDEPLAMSSIVSIDQESSLFAVYMRRANANKREERSRFILRSDSSHVGNSELRNHINRLFHGSTLDDTKTIFLNSLGIGSMNSLRNALETNKYVSDYTLNAIRLRLKDDIWVNRLQGLLLAIHTPMLLNILNDETFHVMKRISYLGPIRATASRYYRQQDLSTEEIDPQGANVAMYLLGLSHDDLQDFSDWCSAAMGFKVAMRNYASHASIYIGEDQDNGMFNIADMGFGYSQILPLLVSLWSSKRQSLAEINFNQRIQSPFLSFAPLPQSQTVHIVEQPELHLHPQMQAKLADLYAKVAASKEGSHISQFILETHSETIINRIGELIYLNKLDKDDVVVLLVSKDDEISSVAISSYNSEGILQSWPYGFFLPGNLE